MNSHGLYYYCAEKPLSTNDLLQLAEAENITVDRFPCKNKGMTIDLNGTYYIAIDPSLSEQETKEVLAHELGHCMTRGFYTIFTPYRDIGWIEASACHWSYGALLPINWVNDQILSGVDNEWELAENAGVSYDFCVEALKYYSDSRMLV